MSEIQGFVLARWERGEGDLYLELLVEQGRLVRAVARQAVRSKRRFSAGLSPFTLFRFVLGRPRATGYLPLDDATVQRALPGVVCDLHRMAAAGAATTIVRDLACEAIAEPNLYACYFHLLERIEHGDRTRCAAELMRFTVDVMSHAGHAIVLDRCVRCGRAAPDNALVRMTPAEGGIVCGSCGGGVHPMRSVDRRALRALLRGDDSAFQPWMLQWLSRFIEPHAQRGARTVVSVYAHWMAREENQGIEPSSGKVAH